MRHDVCMTTTSSPVRIEAKKSPTGKAWIARITAVGGAYGLDREFLDTTTNGRIPANKHYAVVATVTEAGVYEESDGDQTLLVVAVTGETVRVRRDRAEHFVGIEFADAAAIVAAKEACAVR